MNNQLNLFEVEATRHLQELDMLIKNHHEAIDRLKIMRGIIQNLKQVEILPTKEEFLSLPEAASFLGVSDVTVIRRLKHLKYIRDDKGSTWITKSSLISYKARI